MKKKLLATLGIITILGSTIAIAAPLSDTFNNVDNMKNKQFSVSGHSQVHNYNNARIFNEF